MSTARPEDAPDVATLAIKGVRQRVEISGTNGVFYRILVGGEPLKQVKGRWLLPAAGGKEIELRQRGLLPGFQKLVADGEVVYRLGGDVPVWLRVIMFAPFALTFLHPLFGSILGLILFFMNIHIVKNPHMPLALRTALPFVNAGAAAAILLILGNAASGAGA